MTLPHIFAHNSKLILPQSASLAGVGSHIIDFLASPFVSLAMDPAHEHFAVGTSDGQIRVYDMTMEDSDYRLLHQVDVARILRRRREEELEQMKAAANAGTVLAYNATLLFVHHHHH